jgi:hypothetical protein
MSTLLAPMHKCLAGTLKLPPAEQIRERERRVPLALARHENQRRQDRLRFLEAQAHLPAPTTPPQSGAGSARGLPVLSTRPGA